MSTAQELDYTTLKWVKNEIDENLKQTRQALETYVENPQDSTQLRFCTTYLHQIYGTLQMVEIYGGALLAEEMEKLALALLEDKVRLKDDAYDVLMRAILQLPSYLEHLEHGEQDRPVILLPLLNDLRSSRGEHLLSENAFFSPNLSISTPIPSDVGERKSINLQTYAKKLRSVFQSSLVGLYRGENAKESLRKIGAVFKELLVHSNTEASKRLWWVASGVTEALFEGGLENNNHVKQLISQIDGEIKRLIAEGESALEQHPATDLLKNLLYYVATAKSQGKRVSQIKNAFKLEQLLPSSDDISQAFERLRGTSNDLLGSVTGVIKDDLLQIKDQLDIFVRNKDQNSADLAPFVDQLGRMSDTLAMLGLGDLHKILQDQIGNIQTIIESGGSPSEMSLMEIASALLYIESSLESIDPAAIAQQQKAQQQKAEQQASEPANNQQTTGLAQESSASLLPPSEQKQLTRLVISEASNVLADIKERFNTFANDTSQWAVIKETPLLLNQVKGVLAVLNLGQAAKLLQCAINYVTDEMIKKQRSPNDAALDELADVITSIEYYLEAITEARANPETILVVAYRSAEKLGYNKDSLAHITATDLSFLIPETDDVLEPSDTTLETSLALATGPHTERPNDDNTLRLDMRKMATEAENLFSLERDPFTDLVTTEAFTPDEPTQEVLSSTKMADRSHDLIDFDIQDHEHRLDEEIILSDNALGDTLPSTINKPAESQFKGQPLDEIDEEILEIFIEEADEILVSMRENLKTWRNHTADKEALAVLRRSYHTIKGSGRLAGASVVGEFAWCVENMLNKVIEDKIGVSPSLFVLMEQSEQALVELTKQLKGQPSNIPDIDYLSRKADDFSAGKDVSMAAVAIKLEATTAVAPISNITPALDTPAFETHSLETPSLEAHSLGTHSLRTREPLPTHDGKLVDIFKKETAVHLQSVAKFIEQFPTAATKIVSEPLMRALHTLHGSARVANAQAISVLSEPLDRYFRTLYDSELPINAQSFDLLKSCVDYIAPLAEQFDGMIPTRVAEKPKALLECIAQLHNRAMEVAGEHESDHAATGSERNRSLDEDAELTGIFLEEAKEILSNVGHTLALWRERPKDVGLMEEMQRLLHTLKGGARMANAEHISEFCLAMENGLESFRLIPSAVDQVITGHLQQCHQWLVQAVAEVAKGHVRLPGDLIPQLHRLQSGFASAETSVLAFSADEASSANTVKPADDEELLHIFLEEADDLLFGLERTLDRWLRDSQNPELLGELQRALHTLKGGARMANVNSIATVSHSVESVLEKFNTERLPIDNKTTQLVQAVYEWLHVAIDQAKNHAAVPLPPARLLHGIENLLTGADSTYESDTTPIIARESTAGIDWVDGDDQRPAASAAPIEIAHFDHDEIKATPIPTPETSSADYDPDLLEIFLEEADEIQHSTEQTLHQWSRDIDNRAFITQLQRDLHTLKGGARMAGVTVIGDLSHAIETLLEGVTEGYMSPTPQFPLLIQHCHDWLSHAIDEVKQFKGLVPPRHLLRQLENLRAGKQIHEGVAELLAEAATTPVISATETEVSKAPEQLIELPVARVKHDPSLIPLFHTTKRNADEQVRVKADLIDNLVNHAGEANIYNARIAQQLNAWQFNLTELSQTVYRLNEQLRKFEIEAETQIMYRHTTESFKDDNPDFDPLELDRFSYMQQLSRGMVESLGDLTSIKDMLGNISGEADVLLLQQGRVNTDLQEGLMRTRLTPFSSVLARLRRVVRQTSDETGKEANLNVQGADGQIDRMQLNRIAPALEHILRNAVDHGLELPEQRRAAGKPADGQIDIVVSRAGSEIIIRISDDGAGINLDALRQKAIERGSIKEGTKLTDHELLEFILESGFSTAKNVTQISGRGVGMDVVNNEIKQLNGSLHIDTVKGQGSTFTIRLPLTVLVNQALLLNINESQYALPLSNIEHIVRIDQNRLSRLISGEERSFDYADKRYDHLDLSLLLHGIKQNLIGDTSMHPLLLARSGDQRVALHVDSLLGRQEIVIKSIGPQLSSLAHISGATILTNGEVALILDLSSLIRSSHTLLQLEGQGQLDVKPKVVEQRQPLVMVVDDSITVRKVTQRLLKRHAFETITAKDGVDALTVMLETVPDIMLLDVEMPRMDGFELASAMRNDERLKNVPIIMITSRTGDKHRDRAFGIGVNRYMGKPYHEHDLLENINVLLKEYKDKNLG